MLQENKEYEVSSYSRKSWDDLVDELYQELIDKSPELKNLEKEIGEVREKQTNLNEGYNKYDSKSSRYYSSAQSHVNSISDSTLKNKMLAITAKSSNRYNKNTELHSTLISQISKNEISINDYYIMMKVLLTLPIIEKYQDDNLPSIHEFKDLIELQEKVKNQVKNLTPVL